MNAEQYLSEALSGNMNISTLKPLAWHEIMEDYARHKLAEACQPATNSRYATALDVWKEYHDSYPDHLQCFDVWCQQSLNAEIPHSV